MTGTNHDHDENEYVGAPTEYADVEEVPEWVATLVKILWAVPAALATLTVIQLVFLVIVLAFLALCGLSLLVL